jgi:phage terminase large subunit GpA-like protein
VEVLIRHFPKYGEEYFKQITAEQLVTRIVKGYRRMEWQKTRDRNEALDCRNYARAAAAVYGMDRFMDAHWQT